MFDLIKTLKNPVSFFFDKKTGDKNQSDLARSGTKKERMTLAKSSKTNQEILLYLASHDPDAHVREAVVNNKAMPLAYSSMLLQDTSPDVRLALANRLAKLLPHLDQNKQSQLYAFAVQALGTLALDEVIKIRKALSSTLKDYAQTPHKVAGVLARDVEREVSEPILRFCVALSDEDLLSILKNHPASWTVQAIAARPKVTQPVSHAVIETDDRHGGVVLMANKGADIGKNTLMTIVEKAEKYPEWQKPVAMQSKLSPEMAIKLAEFADASVRGVLSRRSDFNPEAIEGISAIFRRRMAFDGDNSKKPKGGQAVETPTRRAAHMHRDGQLSEDLISDALGMRDRAFVVAAVALLAKTSEADVERIIALKAPKAVVALCWKAGLSMRFALQVQQELAQILPKELIYPRGGTDYPLTREELQWQIDFLGLK